MSRRGHILRAQIADGVLVRDDDNLSGKWRETPEDIGPGDVGDITATSGAEAGGALTYDHGCDW